MVFQELIDGYINHTGSCRRNRVDGKKQRLVNTKPSINGACILDNLVRAVPVPYLIGGAARMSNYILVHDCNCVA